ncbi:MAG: ParA family protein [Magnetococcus sp. DMHC-1]|nr:AAA family ATPase [Magnetococcales bacterium]
MIFFDESIEKFLKHLVRLQGIEFVRDGYVLRDTTGKLAFICNQAMPGDSKEKIIKKIKKILPNYSRDNDCIMDIEQPGVQSIINNGNCHYEKFNFNIGKIIYPVDVRIIDHRMIGSDWLIAPECMPKSSGAVRIVFASMKGGVGRSTALVVLAAELARQGRTVLTVDLDLEAPGLGSMLLAEREKPLFGSLDWYVESGVGGVKADDREFLNSMIAASSFGGNQGTIDVVPAVGRNADTCPANVLAKLSRAYLDQPQDSGQSLSFLTRTRTLIDQLASWKHYDAILIDARAGLSELTAAALLGLNADVLLFGVNTPQTFASYRYLLAHLARFIKEENRDWIYRFRMIHAKAPANLEQQKMFRDRAYEIFSEFFYKEYNFFMKSDEDASSVLEEPGLDDPSAPHYAWPILSNSQFMEFDPLADSIQLDRIVYESTFGSLMRGVSEWLEIPEGIAP